MTETHDELADLFPGKTVEIKGNGRSIRVTVYPMAVKHFRTFKDSVTRAMEKIGKAPAGADWTSIMMPMVVQIAAEDLLDIVNECVVGIDLKHDRCPNWVYPIIVKEWVIESFGAEDKIRPWISLLEELAERVGGQKVKIWQTLTQRSSSVAGTSQKSTN